LEHEKLTLSLRNNNVSDAVDLSRTFVLTPENLRV
jgi:hypothetical protein